MKKHSKYESDALKQIHAWKTPKRTWFDGALEFVSTPFEKVGELAMKIPGAPDAIQKSANGIIGLVNDASQWSVRPQAILDEFQGVTGKKIHHLNDLYNLDLQVVDKTIGWLDSKYEGLALVEGVAAGGGSVLTPAAAIVLIPVDIVALLTMNLRAVGEYATYCGFDVSLPEERLFALNVLALASSSTDNAKQLALSQLVRIATDIAAKKTWKELEKYILVQAIQQIAKTLSIRLTKAKLANFIPMAGSLIGGGFNAYYTDKVCKSAFYLYRERFLAEKYGVKDIEITVPPAESLIPNYEIEV